MSIFDEFVSPGYVTDFKANVHALLTNDGGLIDPSMYTAIPNDGAEKVRYTKRKSLPKASKKTQANEELRASTIELETDTIDNDVYDIVVDIDRHSKQDTNSNIDDVVAKAIQESMRGQRDQVILDALGANILSANTVDVNVGGSTTSLNTAKLKKASQILRKQNAKTTDLVGIFHTISMHGLLEESTGTNYNLYGAKLVEQGTAGIDKLLGINRIVEFADPVQNYEGLKLTGTTRKNFVYSKDCIFVTIRENIELDFMKNPKTGGLRIFCYLKMGAKVAEQKGVVLVETHE